MFNVATSNRIEATISFGFDADDPDRGPFLDPLNKQGRHANALLDLVEDVLRADPDYVARLERHYAITKDIIAGRLRPEDAPTSKTLGGLSGVTDLLVSKPAVELDTTPFDIHQSAFDEYGEADEERTEEYADALTERFGNSTEAQPLREQGADLSWPHLFLHYAIGHLGLTPPEMSIRDVEEVLFEIMPRKVSVEAEQAGEMIVVLRAFWSFLQREYQLKNARRILELLGTGATERLHDALDNPANFGMAKSFFMAGQASGFDMTTQEGLTAFMLAYNSQQLANRAVERPRTPPSLPYRLSGLEESGAMPSFANRAERRAAERAQLRDDKKRQRQAKRQNRR
jgi:hypothetical protein